MADPWGKDLMTDLFHSENVFQPPENMAKQDHNLWPNIAKSLPNINQTRQNSAEKRTSKATQWFLSQLS